MNSFHRWPWTGLHPLVHSRLLILFLGLALALTACGTGQELPADTPVGTLSVATVVPEPSPTEARPQVLYYQAGESYPELALDVLATLQDLARGSGMDLIVSDHPPLEAELAGYQVAVLFSPEESYLASIQAVSGVSLIVIGDDTVPAGDRVWTIGDLEGVHEQAAFLAGYIAALLTPDWRAGVIGVPSTDGKANLLEAFVQGGQFFCGLCRPEYPPYYAYPATITLSSNDAQAMNLGMEEAEAKGLRMLLVDEVAADLLGSTVTTGNINFLGLQPPAESLRAAWIATLKPAPEQALFEIWDMILSGSPGRSIPIPILMDDVNPEYLTPGKLLLVDEIRNDLIAGFIQPIGSIE